MQGKLQTMVVKIAHRYFYRVNYTAYFSPETGNKGVYPAVGTKCFLYRKRQEKWRKIE